jgi:hypothetical protein
MALTGGRRMRRRFKNRRIIPSIPQETKLKLVSLLFNEKLDYVKKDYLDEKISKILNEQFGIRFWNFEKTQVFFDGFYKDRACFKHDADWDGYYTVSVKIEDLFKLLKSEANND